MKENEFISRWKKHISCLKNISEIEIYTIDIFLCSLPQHWTRRKKITKIVTISVFIFQFFTIFLAEIFDDEWFVGGLKSLISFILFRLRRKEDLWLENRISYVNLHRITERYKFKEWFKFNILRKMDSKPQKLRRCIEK